MMVEQILAYLMLWLMIYTIWKDRDYWFNL
jgi:hypothetical protein